MHAYLFAMLRLHKDTPYVSYLPVARTLSVETLANLQHNKAKASLLGCTLNTIWPQG